VTRGLSDGVAEADSRLIAATVGGMRVVCCYVPNGQTLTSDKYPYKIAWLTRLRSYLDRHHDPSEPLVLCGDFNVAPEDRDCHDPAAWADSVLCHPDVRERLSHVLAWGLEDTYRRHVPDAGKYSWWDYRQLAFPKGRGLRIDFVFASRGLIDRCRAVHIDRDERKGKLPSDHAPVIAEFDLG